MPSMVMALLVFHRLTSTLNMLFLWNMYAKSCTRWCRNRTAASWALTPLRPCFRGGGDGFGAGVVTVGTAEQREEDVWAIDGTRTGGGELKGLISLKKLDEKQSEIGYWVAPAFWNTGLASEAVQGLIAANPLGNTSFFASVFQDNPASAQVLTHCGFQYLGDAESYSVARDATFATWTYSRKL